MLSTCPVGRRAWGAALVAGLLLGAGACASAEPAGVSTPPRTLAERLDAGPEASRTTLDSSLCQTTLLTAPPSPSDAPATTDAAGAWLARHSPLTGARLRVYMPGEFNWWSRKLTGWGRPAAQALATAIHESLHHVGRAMRLCAGDRWHYFLDGELRSLAPREHGQTPYGRAADFVETGALRAGLRFRHYMAGGGLSESNDFYVLLDELNAYIAEGEFLLSVWEDPVQAEALARTGVQTDAGLGGAVEFQLFALAYLALQCRDPDAASCRTLQEDEALLAFVRSRFERVESLIQRRERLAPPLRALVAMPPGVEQERQRAIWEPLRRRLGL